MHESRPSPRHVVRHAEHGVAAHAGGGVPRRRVGRRVPVIPGAAWRRVRLLRTEPRSQAQGRTQAHAYPRPHTHSRERTPRQHKARSAQHRTRPPSTRLGIVLVFFLRWHSYSSISVHHNITRTIGLIGKQQPTVCTQGNASLHKFWTQCPPNGHCNPEYGLHTMRPTTCAQTQRKTKETSRFCAGGTHSKWCARATRMGNLLISFCVLWKSDACEDVTSSRQHGRHVRQTTHAVTSGDLPGRRWSHCFAPRRTRTRRPRRSRTSRSPSRRTRTRNASCSCRSVGTEDDVTSGSVLHVVQVHPSSDQ